MNNLQDIKARLLNGGRVTADERAYLITRDPAALFAFMIDNNPGPVNLVLRQLGYDHLGFAPDPKALAAQVEILINRKDSEALAAITKDWTPNEGKESPEFWKALQAAANTVTT